MDKKLPSFADLAAQPKMLTNTIDIQGLNFADFFRRNSIAYDLSNDDYSADLAAALGESSFSNEQDLLSRKQSTITFGEQNPDRILQKRKRRKNRHRKGTNFYPLIQKHESRHTFRSPQLTYQMKHLSKSHTITPQIKKFNPMSSKEKSDKHDSYQRGFEEEQDKIKLELEEEFKQYLDFSENQQQEAQLPPRLMLSPSKMDITTKIFSKHKRFSIHPISSNEDNIIKDDRSEKLDKHDERKNSSSSLDQYQKPRDKKYERKQNNDYREYFGNKHLKYKFQTHKNQLKKVPHAPFNNNRYLMQNISKPIFDNTPTMQKLSSNSSSDLIRAQPSQISENRDSQQNQYFSQNVPETPYVLRDINFNDLGASMAFVINSDSFLNDENNIDLCDQKTASEHKEDTLNQAQNISQSQIQENTSSLPGQFVQERNQNEDLGIRLPNKREQMIKEIEQQKRLISKLLKEIGEKDKILKEYSVKKLRSEIPPQQ